MSATREIRYGRDVHNFRGLALYILHETACVSHIFQRVFVDGCLKELIFPSTPKNDTLLNWTALRYRYKVKLI